MFSRRVLLCAAAIALSTAAQAEVVTVNLASYLTGANISNAFSGVALRKLRQLSGTTYSPTVLSVIKGTCNYGGCVDMTSAGQMGSNSYLAHEYHDCLNGIASGCSGYEVFQATFTNPTDFVELEFSWIIDPPVIYGYDALGNEIASCLAGTAGCSITRTMVSGNGYVGTIRLISTTANIKRVVAGSAEGSSRVTGLQYNRL